MDRRRFLLRSAALPACTPALLRGSDAPPLPPPALEDEKYWNALRWHFSIPADAAYCNTGTLGASPKSVVHAVCDHMRHVEAALATHTFLDRDRPMLIGGYQDEPALRARIGKLLGCAREEVALTQNATVGMSYVAQGLRLTRGDRVVMTDQEHPGGRAAYDLRRKRDGIQIFEVALGPLRNDPTRMVAAFRDAVTPDTKVLALPQVSSALGLCLPVQKIVAAARQRAPGVFVVVDGAQALGQIPVDVANLDCDAYFASAHKWLLGPKGTGVLFVGKRRERQVWTTIASRVWDFADDIGRRFTHVGTGNQSLHRGLDAALDFLERIGLPAIHARIKTLGDRLRAGLQKIDGVTILGSTHAELSAGITAFAVRGFRSEDAVRHLLTRDRILTRVVTGGIRQSLHVYNGLADVDRTLARVTAMASGRDAR